MLKISLNEDELPFAKFALYQSDVLNGEQSNKLKELFDLLWIYSLILLKFDGKIIPYDSEAAKCTVDSRNIYFQALNIKNANKRVSKWKSGLIKELFNLDKPNKDGIKLW